LAGVGRLWCSWRSSHTQGKSLQPLR
jgi:hypothetical protein